MSVDTGMSARDAARARALQAAQKSSAGMNDGMHAGLDACNDNADVCGKMAADVAKTGMKKFTGREEGADAARESVTACGEGAVVCAVQAARPHVDPCTQRTEAACVSAANRTIDKSADACASVGRSLGDRCSII